MQNLHWLNWPTSTASRIRPKMQRWPTTLIILATPPGSTALTVKPCWPISCAAPHQRRYKSGTRLDHLRINLHHVFITAQPDLTILDRTLQLHRSLRQLGQGLTGIRIDVDHGQVLSALDAAAGLIPPNIANAAIAIDDHIGGTAAGFQNALVVGLTDFDPQVDGAGQVFLPDIRFFHIRQTLAK